MRRSTVQAFSFSKHYVFVLDVYESKQVTRAFERDFVVNGILVKFQLVFLSEGHPAPINVTNVGLGLLLCKFKEHRYL
jgi:hypothetical protein